MYWEISPHIEGLKQKNLNIGNIITRFLTGTGLNYLSSHRKETQDKKSMNFNMNQASLKTNFTHKEIRIASNSQQTILITKTIEAKTLFSVDVVAFFFNNFSSFYKFLTMNVFLYLRAALFRSVIFFWFILIKYNERV